MSGNGMDGGMEFDMCVCVPTQNTYLSISSLKVGLQDGFSKRFISGLILHENS